MSEHQDSHIRRMDEILNEPVLDHEYDGIEELDNPLPGWWLATFYITIVFSAFYFYYHNISGGGVVAKKGYDAEMVAYQTAKQEKIAAQSANLSPEQIAKDMQDPGKIAEGAKVYTANCAACHAADGGGDIGPNLVDNHWLNGDGSPMAIREVIDKGVTTKGMPAWGPVIGPEQLTQVSAYVVSLKGSKPAKPKAPQGNEVK